MPWHDLEGPPGKMSLFPADTYAAPAAAFVDNRYSNDRLYITQGPEQQTCMCAKRRSILIQKELLCNQCFVITGLHCRFLDGVEHNTKAEIEKCPSLSLFTAQLFSGLTFYGVTHHEREAMNGHMVYCAAGATPTDRASQPPL